MAIELAKTNLYAAEGPVGVLVCKTNLYVVENTEPAFPTPNIRVQKAVGLVTARLLTPNIRVQKATNLTLFNYPTPHIRVQMARALPVLRAEPEMRVQKAAALVVCRGRRAHPEITPWTYTIDGHDYLVINTFNETLVYDFHSGQWATYGGGDTSTWRPQVGQNWNANIGQIMATLGGQNQTNVICGDDTSDTLYFLDPELVDDMGFEGTPGKKFQRVVTGQLAMRGHNYQPCPAVELTCSNGDAPVGGDLTVELKVSDDRGHSYWSAGQLEVVPGQYDITLAWRSLGSFTGPGRLFRFSDQGAVYRIDGMDIPDGR